jgi:Putative zinc-finger
MKDFINEPCGRADDLVAFLYHELSEKEARNFERHLRECAGCERELASFSEIRDSIVSWRDAALGSTWSTSDATALQPAVEASPGPSALAAIREFFTLSPMWMKGAAAFASVLFCVCAVLAIYYLKDRRSIVVQAPSNKIYSQQELDTRIAQAVEKNLEVQEVSQKSNDRLAENAASPQKPRNRSVQIREAGYVANTRNLRKPLTQQERRELAIDLGLASRDEDDLDPINERVTQTP